MKILYVSKESILILKNHYLFGISYFQYLHYKKNQIHITFILIKINPNQYITKNIHVNPSP